jgi:hypothetical protein
MVEHIVEFLFLLINANLLTALLSASLLAAVSTIAHVLLAVFAGGARPRDWRLIRRYIDNPDVVSERGFRQFWLDQIRKIDREMPRRRRACLRAVSSGLPVLAACDIILLEISPLGTTGFGLATLLELTAILFVHLPMTLMQFTWRGRRWLGVLWIVMAAVSYLLPFGQALCLVPYHYLWNLLLPYRDRVTRAAEEALGRRDAARGQVGIECSVFVSYARKDEQVIVPDVALLKGAGCAVWFDRDLEPGDDWLPTISQHVVSADVVLVFVSRSSLRSEFVERELHVAIKYKKRIVPIFIEPVTLPPAWEMGLGTLQAVDRYNLGRNKYEADLLNKLRNWMTPD